MAWWHGLHLEAPFLQQHPYFWRESVARERERKGKKEGKRAERIHLLLSALGFQEDVHGPLGTSHLRIPPSGHWHTQRKFPSAKHILPSTLPLPFFFFFFFLRLVFFFCMYTFPTLTANYLSKRKNKQTNNKHLCFISSFWKNRLLIANLLNF